MKKLLIKDVARAVGAETFLDGEITNVCTDTRALDSGCLFAAVRGERFDGHCFAKSAVEKGAAAVLAEKETGSGVDILVSDTRDALLSLAKYYRGLFDIPLVGITGSVGKTTIKDMTHLVLSSGMKTLKTENNFNNDIGLPRTLFRLEEGDEAAVVEMGMNHFGEISRLSRTAAPTVGIIGNIGVSHIENLGSRENILKAKLELLDGMVPGSPLILNGDDEYLAGVETANHPVYRYGIENSDCRFRAYDIKLLDFGSEFTIDFGGASQRILLPAPGRHNIYNALAAFAAGFLLGIAPEMAAQALGQYSPSGLRMKRETVKGVTLLEDCYNASPDSQRAALEILHNFPAERKIAVLGDMLELGGFSTSEHEKLGVLAAQSGADLLLTFGRASTHTVRRASELGLAAESFESKQALAERLIALVKPGDVILFKASRGMRLEDVINILCEELKKR